MYYSIHLPVYNSLLPNYLYTILFYLSTVLVYLLSHLFFYLSIYCLIISLVPYVFVSIYNLVLPNSCLIISILLSTWPYYYPSTINPRPYSSYLSLFFHLPFSLCHFSYKSIIMANDYVQRDAKASLRTLLPIIRI